MTGTASSGGNASIEVSAETELAAGLFFVGVAETLCAPDPAAAHARFAADHALLIRPGVDPALLARFAAVGAGAFFISDPIEELGHRWIEAPHRLGAAIELAFSRRVLLDWLEAVTGCGAIVHIEGRVVETRPRGDEGAADEPQDGLVWHSDTFPHARLGLTLHLGDADYTGGEFELREKAGERQTFRHAAAQAGDVVVFAIDPATQHRVMPVLNGAPRRVFTGWFVSERI